ncbi:phage portal protein [Rummeliibacillus pycnus]|uniref:phage portal protein n=1 Tax=Rummeliibacillus pycnus TaxID=101070 RepID=UPI0037C8E893
MKDFIGAIKKNGITPILIKEMIEVHQNEHNRMIAQYERYKADAVPIQSRKTIEYEDFETGAIKRIDNKVNNMLNNSFDSDIVDTKVGYMFGIPITYDMDRGESKSNVQPPLLTEMETFNIRNAVEDKDSEWGKKAAICGYGARLAYIDTGGNERITNINPWEVFILSGTSDITEPTYAMRYFITSTEEGEVYKAEFYDETKTYYFQSDNKGGSYTLIDEQENLFDFVPLFGLPNNEELKGDVEKVYSLIDAYDRTLSDASNEIEQYRLAYLILRGVGMDEKDIENLNKSGVFELLGDNDEVKYLTKDINDQMIENHLDRLEENILRFSQSVNFGDGTFGTSVTGIALRYKLMALETKCMTMERKMSAALRYQFKVLCSSWSKRGKCSNEDYLKVFFTFKRNIPVDLLSEAQANQALLGLVSERTRLSALTIVDDVQYELDEMKKEKDAYSESLGGLGD